MSFLRLDQVSKSYVIRREKRIDALRDVCLAFDQGEKISILGASGSGKTTLLRLIAGLEKPSGGSIWNRGKNWDSIAPENRGVSLSFQQPALYPHLTVRENIAFPLQTGKVSASDQKRRMEEVVEFFGLGSMLAKLPEQLSGGERQRVSLARTLVREAEMYLLDEPWATLDLPLRRRLQESLLEWVREKGATLVYVTHDQAEALRMGDRVAVFRRGLLLQVDSPQKIYHFPSSLHVAEFVGDPPINIIEVNVRNTSAGWELVFEEGLALLSPHNLGKAGPALFGIRAESVTLTSGEGLFRGMLKEQVFQGAQTWARVEWRGKMIWAKGAAGLRNGEPASLQLDVGQGHLFDRATGWRLNQCEK